MANVKKLSEGTVKDAEKALPDLTDAELTELRDLEEAGDKRVTLLNAIEAELEGRGDKLTGRDARFATMSADFAD